MGVWIETYIGQTKSPAKPGHTLYGCVDWNYKLKLLLNQNYGHTLYGCVDWNKGNKSGSKKNKVTPCMGVWIETTMSGKAAAAAGHTLYGCVDWNSIIISKSGNENSHTLYGCVDWNMIAFRASSKFKGHTLYGCVDWNLLR